MATRHRSHVSPRPLATLLAVAALAAAAVVVPTTPTAALEGEPTIVSFTFDDSTADQMTAVRIMNANGLHGTFYTSSGLIDADGHLTRKDLATIAATGHEIGGHTVTHPDMLTLDEYEATMQACLDRATLTEWGYQVTSFAYPFAHLNEIAKAAVAACGYNTARGLGDIETTSGCTGCVFAESLPPADPFHLRAPAQVEANWTLEDLQNIVLNAENTTGGWVALTFHHICNRCEVKLATISPSLFRAFTEWVAARASTHNTRVLTVQQAIGGAIQPVVDVEPPPPPGPGVNGVQNPSLERDGFDAVPRCWLATNYGRNVPAFGRMSPGRTGGTAEHLVVARHDSGAAGLIIAFDFGSCSPSVSAGHRYELRAWYRADTVTQFTVHLRNRIGVWEYWTSSPYFPASSEYAAAVWESDPIPRGYTGISFGLTLFKKGTLVTDDYALHDLGRAPGTIPRVCGSGGGDPLPPEPTVSHSNEAGTPSVSMVAETRLAAPLDARSTTAQSTSPWLVKPACLTVGVGTEVARDEERP